VIVLSAESGDLFGHEEMRLLRTAIIGTDPSFQLLSTQNTVSFRNIAFAMNPLRLDWVEPRAFGGQEARENTHALPGLLDRSVMALEPGTNNLTFVPRGVIPDEHKSCDRLCSQMLATGSQKVNRDRADWTTVDEA
jgi:hypothetical protein